MLDEVRDGRPDVLVLGDRPRPSVEEVLLDVAETVATQLDMRLLLDRLATLVQDATRAQRCAILVTDPRDETKLVPAAAASHSPDPHVREQFFEREPLDLTSDLRMWEIWRGAGPVIIEDVPSSTLIPETWKTLGSRSVALSPLRAGKEKFGLLIVDYVTGGHQFTPGEIALLDAVASSAGVAIRNVRLFDRLTAAMAVRDRLLDCTAALRAGGSLDHVLAVVMDGFSSLLAVTHCGIDVVASDGTGVTTLASRGWRPSPGGCLLDRFPLAEVRRIEAEWKRDPRAIIRFPDLRSLEGWRHVIHEDVGPGMLVPLVEDDRVRAFVVAGRHGSRPFSDEEVAVAKGFADQAALAIREARLREALLGRAKAIDALRRLTDVVVGTTDLSAALRALNRGLCSEMGFACLGVTFADRKLCDVLDLSRPSKEEALLVRAWRREPRDAKPVEIHGQRMLVPIRLAGRVAGVLRTRWREQPTPAAMGFVGVLADGIGDVALKAKLRRTAERKAEQLAVAAERERMARDLHDTVGQLLYGLALRVQHCLTLDGTTEEGRQELRERLFDVRSLSAEGVSDVRSAVYALSFLHVRKEGLVRSLRGLVREFSRSAGVEAALRLVRNDRRRIPDEIESVLYRVAHEALVNVDRHARATGVVVTLDIAKTEIALTIRDDGVGLDQRQAADWRSAAHFGLRMMARWIEESGGTFQALPTEPRGLAIHARIPLKGKAGGSR